MQDQMGKKSHKIFIEVPRSEVLEHWKYNKCKVWNCTAFQMTGTRRTPGSVWLSSVVNVKQAQMVLYWFKASPSQQICCCWFQKLRQIMWGLWSIWRYT